MEKTQLLKKYFGHNSFRPGQEELIDAVLSGRDALGIMPTGGGKSICYQLPAMMLPGLAVVISPLISLMEDQVLALREAGIPAACFHSSLSSEEMAQLYRDTAEGKYKILYAAPERLDLDGFIALMQSVRISLIAVDEAHCISQWGQNFRPGYLKIPDFIDRLPRRPVVCAYTATATELVRRDIIRYLSLRDPLCTVTGFDRPNLFFEVLQPKDKTGTLLRLISARRGKSGIVYCSTRKTVEEVCTRLCSAGFTAVRYHAGLTPEERSGNQESFICDRSQIMVATNAFGMGIDKSNVSYVIHYNMPRSIEAYYQEAGRAGRDGEAADCILLFSPSDIATAKYLTQHAGDNNEELSSMERERVLARDMKRLHDMVVYCRTEECLRGKILSYFGEAHRDSCTACANCRRELCQTDITVPSQMILSCIKRIHDKLGYYLGPAALIRVLRGSREQRVAELHLNELPTFGLMKSTSRERIEKYLFRLDELGYITTDPRYGSIRLTEKAAEVLFRGERVSLPEHSTAKAAKAQPRPVEYEDPVYEALLSLRTRLAQEEGVPAYVVLSNAVLRSLAKRQPTTMLGFRLTPGIGDVKAKKYGRSFIKKIRELKSSS